MNEELRALFPITETAVYLNHAAVSPLSTLAVEAINRQLQDISRNGSVNFRQWVATKERCRVTLAAMIGARAEQVAFMRNTSDGLSSLANGLRWDAGDNIVTFRGEFPSNIYPWLRIRDAFGVELRMCEERDGRVDPDELLALVDDRTRVVAISHVQYASGFRSDLARIGRAARAVDALLVVDAIQSLGVLPFNVESDLVDAAAWACHKWLLAPEGIGAIYISDRARARVEPTLVGWISVPNPEDYLNYDQAWKPGALAWETGTGPSALFYALEEGLKLLAGIGPVKVAKHLQILTDHLCERLSGSEYEVASSRREGEASQIICIRHRGEWSPMRLYHHLKGKGIVTAPRVTRLRIAPHVYNNVEDIDRLVDALP
jgi:selenocysteine lyase/cysteine desulfurase